MKKYVLITGASGGIGYEFTKLFANDHHNLILVARNEKRLLEIKKELIDQYQIEVEIFTKDLSQENQINELFEQTNQYQVDYLINNAGFGEWCEFVESDWNKQKDMINVNVLALSKFSYHYGKLMKNSQNGKILNVASIAGLLPAGPYLATYFATKSYVLSFSLALASELKEFNVNVSALCPSAVATGFEKSANLNKGSNLFKKFKPSSPVKIAKKGYQGLMKNKCIIKPTWSVKNFDFLMRFVSKKMVINLTKKANAKPINNF